MKLKTLYPLRAAICAGFVSFLALATSCTKNEEENTPAKSDSVYLPVVVYNSNASIDSFVYNSDNTVSTAFYGYASGVYHERFQLAYNSAGQCNRISYSGLTDNPGGRYDSIVYAANGEVTIYRRYPAPSSFDRILRLKLNNDGAFIGFSMDTVMSNTTSLKAFKWDMITNGGNVTQYDEKYLKDGSNGGLVESRVSTKFTYDQRPGSLRDFFRKNPIMQMILGYDHFDALLYTASVNNINGVSVSDNGSTYQTYPVVNTYDEKTGQLIKQVFTQNNTQWRTCTISYKKVAAK